MKTSRPITVRLQAASFFSQSGSGLSWPIRRRMQAAGQSGGGCSSFGSQVARAAAASTNQRATSSCNFWANEVVQESCSCFSQSGLSRFDTSRLQRQAPGGHWC